MTNNLIDEFYREDFGVLPKSQFKSRLRQILEACLPEEAENDCKCDGSGNDLGGYCNCGFSFNDCRDEMKALIDKLLK